MSPKYSTCNGKKYLAGYPQKGSGFQVQIKPPALSFFLSWSSAKRVEIEAKIIFGGLWTSGSRLTLTTVYTETPLVVLTKNDIINSASVDLACEGAPSNSSYGDYAYTLSVTFYYLTSVYIGDPPTDLLWTMDTATGDSAWVAIRDVYMTFQTTPSYSSCPSKTYRPKTTNGKHPCVCKLKTVKSAFLILILNSLLTLLCKLLELYNMYKLQFRSNSR